jgi:hypothetical protein
VGILALAAGRLVRKMHLERPSVLVVVCVTPTT